MLELSGRVRSKQKTDALKFGRRRFCVWKRSNLTSVVKCFFCVSLRERLRVGLHVSSTESFSMRLGSIGRTFRNRRTLPYPKTPRDALFSLFIIQTQIPMSSEVKKKTYKFDRRKGFPRPPDTFHAVVLMNHDRAIITIWVLQLSLWRNSWESSSRSFWKQKGFQEEPL